MWDQVGDGGGGEQTWRGGCMQPPVRAPPYTRGDGLCTCPCPRAWEPGEKPASSGSFRIHRQTFSACILEDLFALNRQNGRILIPGLLLCTSEILNLRIFTFSKELSQKSNHFKPMPIKSKSTKINFKIFLYSLGSLLF